MEKHKSRRMKNLIKNRFLHLLLVLVAGLAAYSNTLEAPFVFDDRIYVTENPAIKDFGYLIEPSRIDSLQHLEDVVRRYLKTRHVAYLSFWANYKISKLDVRGYHAVNLAVHLINSLLLYAFVVLIFKSPFLADSRLSENSRHVAFISAILFVTHPVQIEAVTYITQRFVSLSAMFYLLSCVAYVRLRLSDDARVRYPLYAASLVSAVLAMKSKEIAFTLPVALALIEFFFFKGRFKKRVFLLMPLLLTMLIIPVYYITEKMQPGGFSSALQGATRLQSEMPRADYLFTQSRVIVTYLRLLLLPVNQNFDYDYPAHGSFLDPQVCLSSLFLLSVLGLGAYLLHRSRRRPELRLVSFGVLWFFIVLSVESSIIPISELIYEYRMYLPSAGAIIGMTTFAFNCSSSAKRPVAITAATALLLLAAMVFTALAYSRNSLWRDELGLWKDTVNKSPGKARPHVSLGVVYEKRKMHGEAEREYRTALSINPVDVLAHKNLGLLLEKQGRYDKATDELLLALAIDPDDARAHSGLGYVFEKQGRLIEAEREYRTALRLNPYDAMARYNLARSGFEEQGKYEEAADEYRSILKMNPDFAEAHYSLGVIFEKQGRHEEAEREFLAALRTDPGFSEARYSLGVLYHKKGLYGKAEKQYAAALRIKPDYADARNNLGIIYAEQGRYGEAAREFQAAAGLSPDDEEIKRNLERARELLE
jgi:tetratricopeptide (TPR) repeat protein